MSDDDDVGDVPLLRTFSFGLLTQCMEMVTLGHILDRLKIEQQSNPRLQHLHAACSSILGRGGLPELYRGLQWNLAQGSLKSASRWTLNAGCFQGCEVALGSRFRKEHPSAFSAAVGCTAAFLDTTLMVCPLESLKVRDMTTHWVGGRSRMWWVLREEGLGLLFRGWPRVFGKQVLSWCAYLVGYQQFKTLAEWYNQETVGGRTIRHPIPLHHKVAVASATGMLSTAIHTPMDMLKTQAQMAGADRSLTLRQSAQLVLREHGVRGFYVSLPAKLLRSAWYSTVTLVAMDHLDALPRHMSMTRN
eukprot:EG_transcript_19913